MNKAGNTEYRNLNIALSVLCWTDKAVPPIACELTGDDWRPFIEALLRRLLGNPEPKAFGRLPSCLKELLGSLSEIKRRDFRNLTDIEAYRLFATSLNFKCNLDKIAKLKCPNVPDNNIKSIIGGWRSQIDKVIAEFEKFHARQENREKIWTGYQKEKDPKYLFNSVKSLGGYKKAKKRPDSFNDLTKKLEQFLFGVVEFDPDRSNEEKLDDKKKNESDYRQNPDSYKKPILEDTVVEPPSFGWDFWGEYWTLFVFSIIGNFIYYQSWGWALLATFVGWGIAGGIADDFLVRYPLGWHPKLCYVYTVAPWIICWRWEDAVLPQLCLWGYPLIVFCIDFYIRKKNTFVNRRWWGCVGIFLIMVIPVFCGLSDGIKIRARHSSSADTSVYDKKHYESLKNKPAGLSWKNLTSKDLKFLTEKDLNMLRLQFCNVLTKKNAGFLITEMTDLRECSTHQRGYRWCAKVSINAPLYCVKNAYSKTAGDLDLIINSVKHYALLFEAGEKFEVIFDVNDNYYKYFVDTSKAIRNADVIVGGEFNRIVSRGRTLMIAKDSEFDQTMADVQRLVDGAIDEMAADKLIKEVDSVARKRYEKNRSFIRDVQKALIAMAQERQIHKKPSKLLENIIAKKDSISISSIELRNKPILKNHKSMQDAKANYISKAAANGPRIISQPIVQKTPSIISQPIVKTPSIIAKTDTIRTAPVQQPIIVQNQPFIARGVNVSCPKCHAAKIIRICQACPTCRGSRYVCESVSAAAKTIVDVINVARGRERNKVNRNYIPAKIICPTCKANGQIIVQTTCDKCLGRGVICK